MMEADVLLVMEPLRSGKSTGKAMGTPWENFENHRKTIGCG
jgi:hypothetical protein